MLVLKGGDKEVSRTLNTAGLVSYLDGFLLSLCRILNPTVKKPLKGGDGEIARLYRTFAEDPEDSSLVPHTMLVTQNSSSRWPTLLPAFTYAYIHTHMHIHAS